MSKSVTQILNNTYDEENEQLRGTGIGTQSTNSTMYSAVQILNNVYDEATKTLNIAGVEINDQSASGYSDTGAMRMQWGEFSNTGTLEEVVTLPAAFADTSYVVVMTINGAATTLVPLVSDKTTTTFDSTVRDSAGTLTAATVGWIAIGLKP